MGLLKRGMKGLFFLSLLLMLSVISIPFFSKLYNPLITSWSVAFGIGMAALLMIYGFWLISWNSLERIKITWLDAALILYFILALLNRFAFHSVHSFSLPFLEFIGLSVLYVLLRSSNFNYHYALLAIVISGVIQSVIGNLQLHGYQASRHGYFSITGSFFNPGPYAGYLAIILPITIGLYLQRNNLSNSVSWDGRLKWLKTFAFTYLPILGLFAILSVLPATRSRAAWLAGLAGIAYVLLFGSDITSRLLLFLNHRFKRILALLVVLSLLVVTAIGLYLYKPDSANGRMLIWKVSKDMIGDNLVTGVGYDRFKSMYMIYQAKYFKDFQMQYPEGFQNQDEVWVASDNEYSFNEFLQIGAELGLPGLLLIILILCIILFQRDKKNDLLIMSKAGIISIAIFSLFSYPAQILPIKLALIVFLAIVASSSQVLVSGPSDGIKLNWVRPGRMILASIGILGALGMFQYSIKLYKGLEEWQTAYDYYQMGVYDQAAMRYEKIAHQFNHDGEFLTQYGKSLGFIGETDKAIDALKLATHHLNTTVICSSLGSFYEQTGSIAAAELLYLEAWYMVPNRLYPKYLLAELYHNAGSYKQAYALAKDLLTMEVKVDSKAIQEIRTKAAEMLTKYE